MKVQYFQAIGFKYQLAPLHHDGHAGVRLRESHLAVVVVSEKFEGMRAVKRHMAVNEILKEEFEGGLHALQLSTKTPEEYAKAD